jgi:hypothetical protein
MVTRQVPVLEQPEPVQPVNVEPALGAAVRVTCVPSSYLNEHVGPQSIPPTSDLAVPEPVPVLETLSV